MKLLTGLLTVAAVGTCLTMFAADSGHTYVTVDNPHGLNTGLFGINQSGQISGTYFDDKGSSHAFLLSEGTFTPIDYPEANRTFGFGINNAGKIVGYYINVDGTTHGFFYGEGKIVPIDFPKATATKALGINSSDQIVGTYSDGKGVWHGFLLDQGKFVTVDPPGATRTDMYGINDIGQSVGFYSDAKSIVHGFVHEKDKFTTIDYPGATRTSLYGINRAGEICGSYADASGPHGFVQGSSKARLTFPGALSTFGFAINDSGVVVGQYVDLDSVVHGFRSPTGQHQLPQISARLDPAKVNSGLPGFQLDVRGIAFAPNSVVYWNGLARPTTFVSHSELYATIPAADIAQPGAVPVTVVNPGTEGGTSNVVQYEVVGPGV